MNDNQSNSNSNNDINNIGPYKASGNLNTVISNPSANINNAMDVNIQNSSSTLQSISPDLTTVNPSIMANSVSSQNINQQNINQKNIGINQSTQSNDSNNVQNGTVTKTYVSNNNKPKKKTISLNIGPELKIALLIIVVLLIFIFLLPLLPNLF